MLPFAVHMPAHQEYLSNAAHAARAECTVAAHVMHDIGHCPEHRSLAPILWKAFELSFLHAILCSLFERWQIRNVNTCADTGCSSGGSVWRGYLKLRLVLASLKQDRLTMYILENSCSPSCPICCMGTSCSPDSHTVSRNAGTVSLAASIGSDTPLHPRCLYMACTVCMPCPDAISDQLERAFCVEWQFMRAV